MFEGNKAVLGRRLVDAGYPALELPSTQGKVHPGLILGRSPSEGYARGVGLEFGQLAKQLHAHPLYREALLAAKQRSIVVEPRLMNLFLIITHYFDALEDHNIVEFGAYRGGSSLFMAYLLKRLYPEASLFACDTYAGMPETNMNADLHRKGDFADADLAGFQRAREEAGLDQLYIVQGLVQDTFPAKLPRKYKFGLAHFDMDIYEPTAYAQDAVWPMMTRGGYFVYDDATVSTCIGATQAVEDLIRRRGLHSEQIYPHFVFRVGA